MTTTMYKNDECAVEKDFLGKEKTKDGKKLKGWLASSIVYSFLAAFLTNIAVGILHPSISTLLLEKGFSTRLIGLNSAFFALFTMLGAFIVQRAMKKVVFSYSLLPWFLVTSICAYFISRTENLYAFFVLRSLMGLGIGVSSVCWQTMLHNKVSHEKSGQTSGILILIMIIGALLGSVCGPMIYAKGSNLPFVTISILMGIAALSVPFLVGWKEHVDNSTGRASLKTILFPLFTVFAYGFADLTVFSLFPVYLKMINVPTAMMGFVLGAFIIGAIVSTIPFSILGDKVGKEIMIRISLIIGIIPIILIMFNPENLKVIFAISFFAGAGIGPIRPLALAMVTEKLRKEELTFGNSTFNISYSVGCVLGPLLSSTIMDAFGHRYLFSMCLFMFMGLLFISFTNSMEGVKNA